MGMDVSGKNPRSEKGGYFRNNVWWWRPLWDYCEEVAPELTGKVRHGHSNDGDGLDDQDAVDLAAKLQAEIDTGRTAEYAQQRQAELDALPREMCSLCHGTGVRDDAVGVEHGHPQKLVTTEGPRYGMTGWCNGCEGHGAKKSLYTWYGFDVENVQSFADFLKDSGGFEIW